MFSTSIVRNIKILLEYGLKFYINSVTYEIGYGSTIIEQQKIVGVESVHACGTLDVALLRLVSSIPENKNMVFFTSDRWNLNNFTNLIHGGT